MLLTTPLAKSTPLTWTIPPPRYLLRWETYRRCSFKENVQLDLKNYEGISKLLSEFFLLFRYSVTRIQSLAGKFLIKRINFYFLLITFSCFSLVIPSEFSTNEKNEWAQLLRTNLNSIFWSWEVFNICNSFLTEKSANLSL